MNAPLSSFTGDSLGAAHPLGLLGFELLRPSAWTWLLLALLLGASGLYGHVRRRVERERIVAPAGSARFLPGFSPRRAFLRVALAGTGALLLGISLLGPVRGFTLREVRRTGLDVVVCIDTSRSMLAEDLRPNRLQRAIREVGGMVDLLAGDRVALVAFSGVAREVAPLTHDRQTLKALLAEVDPADNRMGGTDLGIALERALEMFDGRTGAHEAVVLLTDGEDLGGRGLEVASVAAQRGIRVYVVGVGTAAGGKIPVADERGRTSFLVGPEGEEVVSCLEDDSLRALAESTGGVYLSTEMSPAPLEELFEKRISRLDRRELDDGKVRVPHDRFQWSLVLALACMLCEAGLRERRPGAARFDLPAGGAA